jgi:hypothetical protein
MRQELRSIYDFGKHQQFLRMMIWEIMHNVLIW